MTVQFLHLNQEFSCDLGSFGFGLMNDDLLTQFDLSELLLNPHTDPIWIDVDLKFGGVQMFGHFDFEVAVVRIVPLL